MPILIKATASTRATVADYYCNLVVCMLGAGHDWALQESSRGYTHILVAIDKFTKWIEYKLIASLTSTKAVKFIQEIMFRFGIPNIIITDLGSNFTSSEFFDFCEQRNI
jgi:transposase InsO family protein